MRKGVILVVIGTALALAGQAQAHSKPYRLTRAEAQRAITKWGDFPAATVTACRRLSVRTISCRLDEIGYAPFAGADITQSSAWSGSFDDVRATRLSRHRVKAWSPNWADVAYTRVG